MPKYILVDDADDTAKEEQTYHDAAPTAPSGFSVVLDTDATYADRQAELAAFQAPPAPTVRQERAVKYAAELSDGNANSIEALGDTSDAMQKKIRVLAAAILAIDASADVAEADFDDKAAKIDKIKKDHPKPN